MFQSPDETASNYTVGLEQTNNPALLVVEEEDDDSAQNAVVVPVANGGDSDDEMDIGSPVYTGTSQTGTLDNDDSEFVDIYYPDDQATVGAAFVGQDGSISAQAGGEVTYQSIQPIMSPVAQLDTEVEAPADVPEDLILVGGPSVNMHVETLVKNGKLEGANSNATETWNMWSEDTAEIQLVEDAFAQGKTALVVAGYSAEDTRRASKKLQSIGELPDQSTLDV